MPETSVAFQYFPGLSMVILVIWTSTPGLIVSSGLLGFYVASFGPTHAEVGVIIVTKRFFNIAFGYMLVAMGIGWLLGAPAAGKTFAFSL